MRVTEVKAKHSGKCSPSQPEHITGLTDQNNETKQSKKNKIKIFTTFPKYIQSIHSVLTSKINK